MSATRRVRVRALAKINLDLRVLGKSADGYHELRTIFQTISLGDRIHIAFTPGPRSGIEAGRDAAIPDNLVERAAKLVLDATGVRGTRGDPPGETDPDGRGAGGGSSDAAAILLALPVLAGPAPRHAGLMRAGPATRQRRPFLPAGRNRRVGSAAAPNCFRCPDAPQRPRHPGRPRFACIDRRCVSLAGPPFDNRISTK